jgi:hypothetical protein
MYGKGMPEAMEARAGIVMAGNAALFQQETKGIIDRVIR